MSLLHWIPGRRSRRSLRRFSPERARLVGRPSGRAPLPQAGEKLLVAVVAGAVVTLLIGLGDVTRPRAWLGLFALVFATGAFFTRYLIEFRRNALDSLARVISVAAFLCLPIALARLLELFDAEREMALLPLSFVSLVLALAWGRAFALDCTVFSGGLLGLFVLLRPDWERAPAGFAIAMAGALVAVLSAEQVRRRMAVVRVGIQVGLICVLVAGAFVLLGAGAEPSMDVLWWLLLLFVEGLAVGFVTMAALPAIETVFDVTTDVTLLELGNTHEQPLLRKLLLEAPGTFHHSYIVGIISEAAAEAVHANPLLARVGALYHDIGKLNKPEYFAENSPEARMKHKDLTPEMSTLIISAHPRDGVELGSYYGLPQAVLDFMPEHHGTSCIEYFYFAAKELRGEDAVSEEAFRYPGPRPQRIETAIVMIADAVEAISRQMPEPTRTRLQEMVHKVSLKRLMDRQFDECGITLRDLERIEGAMVRVLAGIYHTRPTFPKGKPHPLDLSQTGARAEGSDGPGGPARTAGDRSRKTDVVAPSGSRKPGR